jgi:large subunit ribosomal protein L21
MYAVIQTGGKQYKVAQNDILRVERLEAEPGDTVALESVLMLGGNDGVTVGQPFVEGATVAAEVVEQARGKKIIVFKKLRRKNHRRRNGHRQDLTVLRVTEILTGGKKPSMAKAVAKAKPKAKVEVKPDEKIDAAPEAKTDAKKAEAKTPAAKKAPAKKAPAKKAAPKKAAAKKAAAKTAPAKEKDD